MIEINGVEYAPRPLTLPEVRRVRGMSEDAADAAAIAWSCGLLPAEVEAWLNSVPAGVAMAAVQQVLEISGLTEGAQFPG